MLSSVIGLRLGSDPRVFTEYKALLDELSKLSHPACPDVDWLHVEQLCLALHQENGLELQSMAVLILARTHLYGLPGLKEGLQSLNRQLPLGWSRMWPPALGARLELLSWLFEQLQPFLRTMRFTSEDLPLLKRLGEELEVVAELLMHRAQVPMVALQALCQQVVRVVGRLERDAVSNDLIKPSSIAPIFRQRSVPIPDRSRESIVRTEPEVVVLAHDGTYWMKRRNRHSPWLWLLAVLAIALFGALAWSYSQWRVTEATLAAKMQEPVMLDSLMLFPAGSAELLPEATEVLATGLINIKAQPNWLIVITGHSDNSGDSRQNRELSQARAMAVRDWLQRVGNIPDNCFVVRGVGAIQPISSNDTEQGKAANRRVDVRLVPHAGACNRSPEMEHIRTFPVHKYSDNDASRI